MDNTINYTIIIPHKNIPLLLQRCLDSIPLQRDDIQVIIVDDNSSPDIVDFDNFPGLGLPRTEVYFTKEGRGAGYVRNVGLQHAKGNRLVFADADDFFMPCFNETLNKYKDDEHDIVFFKVTSVDSETMKPSKRHVSYNYLLDKIRQTNNWDKAILLVPPCLKIIKYSLIEQNRITFQEVQYSNDVLFWTKLSQVMRKKTISENIIYCWTHRKDSLMGHHTVDSLCTRFQVACDTFVYLKAINKAKGYYKNISGWWFLLFCKDYKIAISLFSKLIKTNGLWYTCIGIIWAIGSKLKNKIKISQLNT